MKYADMDGNRFESESSQDKLLRRLYGSKAGGILVRIMISPIISEIGGLFLGSPLSKPLIKPFIEKNGIDMSRFEDREFKSYNDFFTRKIKDGERVFPKSEGVLISPSDGKVSCYEINEDCTLSIKGVEYSVSQLLRSGRLAERFSGGYAFVIRLTVDDYHRYCWCCSGKKSENRHIGGFYHTVNPAALEKTAVFRENTREYCIINSKIFGKVVQMEVGATMVGRISNNTKEAAFVRRGDEKGKFEFGGSTIVVFTEKDKISVPEAFLKNTADGYETVVKQGEALGFFRGDIQY